MLVFVEGGKPANQEKTLRARREPTKTQPKFGTRPEPTPATHIDRKRAPSVVDSELEYSGTRVSMTEKRMVVTYIYQAKNTTPSFLLRNQNFIHVREWPFNKAQFPIWWLQFRNRELDI